MIQNNIAYSLIKMTLAILIGLLLAAAFYITFHNKKNIDNIDISLSRLDLRSSISSNFIDMSENAANALSPLGLDKVSAYHGYVEFLPENAQLITVKDITLNKNDTISLRYKGLLNKQLFQCKHDPSPPDHWIESLFFVTTKGGLACCPIENGTPHLDKFEVLIEGVEALRLRYGEDTDNDGIANQYVVQKPTLALNQVRGLKVSLLIKSLLREKNMTQTKYYTLQDIELGPFVDDIHRRVYTISLPLNTL